MTEIIDEIQNTSVRNWIFQILAISIGIIGSVALVVSGHLQEGLLEIVTAPFTGLITQLQILVLTRLEPTLILLLGCIGFFGLILIPGTILSRLIYRELTGFTGLLIGTSISLIIIFFPLTYGLLFGIAPSWVLILIPLFLAITVCILKPHILVSTLEEFTAAVIWLKGDIKKRKHLWFWIPLVFFILVRFSLFSYTDSYWTDSVRYVGYAEAIQNGTLLTGLEFVNPIGFPLFMYPFVWLAGSIPWGLALGNCIVTIIALLGFIPILRRIYTAWPTERKPPFRLVLLVFVSFPWHTILMTSIFHESSLLFITALAAESIGSRLRGSEIWLGLAIGIGYLIRPTHALMYFVFMLIPLYENRKSISNFLQTGLRSFVVALPVIPVLLRNLWIKGSLLVEYDLQFFSLSNIPDVLFWLASFITHSDVGLFTLLFAIPLLFAVILSIKDIPKFNAEIIVWMLLAIISFSVFTLYPSDQPRLFSYFFWLVPIILLMQCWDKGWELTCVLLVAWQFLIFGAIPFSPQGWIIDSGSSYLTGEAGILRVFPTAEVALSYIGSICSIICWMVLGYFFAKKQNDSLTIKTAEEDMKSID